MVEFLLPPCLHGEKEQHVTSQQRARISSRITAVVTVVVVTTISTEEERPGRHLIRTDILSERRKHSPQHLRYHYTQEQWKYKT